MMRIPLSVKILGAFSLIVLLALSISVSAANRFTRNRYDDFAVQRDILRAKTMAPLLYEVIEEADESGINDLWSEIPGIVPLIVRPKTDNRAHHGHGMKDRRNRPEKWHSEPEASQVFDRLLITDSEGWIIHNRSSYPGTFFNVGGNKIPGIEIRRDEDLIGYLYVGRMIPNNLSPGDISFLHDARMRTWSVASVIFIVAIILALILTRHISVPVKKINNAAHAVEKGSLDIRIPSKRKDELGDLTRGFNSMVSSLEKADNQRRRLIADSAHELRTPLSLISTRIEMMKDGIYPLNQEGLSALEEEAKRMTGLIEELRTLSLLESEGSRSIKEPLDLYKLAISVTEANSPAMEKARIRVETLVFNHNHDKTIINADPAKFFRLLNNLLSNALRYAESRIQILLDYNIPESVVIRVDDDGPGIAVDQREKIFERYYRVDLSRSRQSGGSGLGLAICREIVSSHGGVIFAESSQILGGASLVVFLSRE